MSALGQLVTRAYDLVVIGAGSGGLEAAYNAATVYKKRVAVIDVSKTHGPPHYSALGGTCVNVGCVPKKLLVTGAAYHEHFKDARGFGWQFNESSATQAHDWAKMMAGKNKVVADINASYEEMFAADANLDFVLGWGAFEDAHTIAVHATKGDAASITHRLSADTILIATGGWPTPIAVPGAELAISSNEAFYLERAPRRALVVGGGYIAVEFASIFESFRPRGTDPATGLELSAPVTLNYRGDLFLRGFDRAVREELRDQMAARGIVLQFNDTPVRIEKCAGGVDGKEEWRRVTFASGAVADFDVVMFATGRAPNVSSLNLPVVGVAQAADGSVRVDAHSRTSVPHIYSIGDVTNRMQLTPVAIYEGQCFVDTAFGGAEAARAPGYDAIASAVFAMPQIGSVGLAEHDAATKYPRVAIHFSRFSPLMHKMSGQAYKGALYKVVVDATTSRVLGVHIVDAAAGEIIQGVAIAVKMGAKISDFYRTIGVHPTSAEELCSMRTPSYYLVDGVKVDSLPPVAAL